MPLLLSTVFSSLIAMAVMLLALYAPRLAGRKSYDVLRALGSGVTGRLDAASVALGAALFALGGLIFGFLYGLLAQQMMAGGEGLSAFGEPGWVLAFIGLWVGAGHGVFVSLIATVLVIEHHPLERFRGRMGLVPLIMVSHIIFGGVVLFFHYRFLNAFGG